MNRRYTTWLAWSLWLLGVLLLLLSPLLWLLNAPPPDYYVRMFAGVVMGVFLTVGALVADRHTHNAVGWLLLLGALLMALQFFAEPYARYALVTQPGALPGGLVMAWLTTWLGHLAVGVMFTFVPLLFPSGHLPSPRWRPLAWLAGGLLLVGTLFAMTEPGALQLLPAIPNPLGVARASSAVQLFDTLTGALLGLSVVLSGLSLIWRFRHAAGEERQQLKWLAYAAVLAILFFGFWAVVPASNDPLITAISDMVLSLVLVAFAAAIGIAILRYRLYDIDLLIRRTLIYSVLSAALVLTYLGVVVLLQQLFRALTGHDSNAAIVISTLAIAALFNPLRQRIQAFIDRRFYRRKYDAQKTLAAFGQTVRNEVELDKLTGELLRVIEETMQPVHVSIWLRDVTEESKEPTHH